MQLTAIQTEVSQLRQDKEQDAAAASRQINGMFASLVYLSIHT